MSVIGTCGHEFTEAEGLGTTIAIKDCDRKGQTAISYPTICNKCLEWYREKNLILNNKAEEDAWWNK